jgi:cyclic-di-GMP phosphodiesterase, flagellum assembly factor TipF
MDSRQSSSTGLAMLDVVVLIAMAVTAVAFATGLVVHSGIAYIPAVIAAAALYMVMAASYLIIARSTKSAPVTDRLNELEEALEIIDADLQRIDRVEDDVARLDLLNDRVERLDQAVSQGGQGAGGIGRYEQFASEFDEVHSKIDGLRTELEGEARSHRDKIASDLRTLEGLIKQLSREVAAATGGATTSASAPTPAPAVAVAAPIPSLAAGLDAEDDEDTPAVLKVAETLTIVVEEEPSLEDAPTTVPSAALKEEAAAPEPAQSYSDSEMLDVVAQALENGRVDLYLRPTVTLPERRPRYFEALTRIRTRSDELITPSAYLSVAESSGMIPLIDNVQLVKSVQALRRLGPKSRIKGFFCNISVRTLLDPEFFPELVEFMEENSGLSESLIFEVNQPAILALETSELGSLDTLGALGYRFSLDHVSDLDVDFAGLRDRHFRFVKVDSKTFLHDMEVRGKGLPGADMKSYLDTFDLKLVVDQVDDEGTVAKLLDYGVELAQGNLFGAPKPVSPALLRELEEADAA